MNWAQIKKSVNSDLNTPLNSKIDSQTTSINNNVNTKTNTVLAKFGFVLKRFATVNTEVQATNSTNPMSFLMGTSNISTAITCDEPGFIYAVPVTIDSANSGTWMLIGSKITSGTNWGGQTIYYLTDIVGVATDDYQNGRKNHNDVLIPVIKGKKYYVVGKGNFAYYAFGGAITNFLKYLLLMLSLQRREVL